MRKFTFSRSVSAVLIILTILNTGCSSAVTDNNTQTENVTAADQTSSESIEATLYSDLPTGDYGGESFTIFNNSMTYAIYLLDAESQNGEIFNDSVYDRTRLLEEKLNIQIELIERDTWSGDTASFVTNSILSGEDKLNACFISLMFVNTTEAVLQSLFSQRIEFRQALVE